MPNRNFENKYFFPKLNFNTTEMKTKQAQLMCKIKPSFET